MKLEELEMLESQRQEGETINQVQQRLEAFAANTAVASPMVDEDGLEEGDLAIPRWRIVQPTTRTEGVTAGTFYNLLTGEKKEKLENIVILKRQNGRVLFKEGDFSDGTRLCWSYNGLVPATQDIIEAGLEPKAQCCVDKSRGSVITKCPLAVWHNDAGKKRGTPPECKDTITLLAVDSMMLPFYITFHGTALKPTKNLLGQIYLQKRIAQASGKLLNLRDFTVTVAVSLKTTSQGKFYMPVYENLTHIESDEKRAVLESCFTGMQEHFEQGDTKKLVS